MTTYGILMVDTDWANDDSARIDKTAQLRHREEFAAGTRVLIYAGAPIAAVIAEVEITGDIIAAEMPLPDPPFNAMNSTDLRQKPPLEQVEAQTKVEQPLAKTYRVPLKLLHLKGQVAPISMEKLRQVLGSDFSMFDELWFALSKREYETITGEWEKGKTT